MALSGSIHCAGRREREYTIYRPDLLQSIRAEHFETACAGPLSFWQGSDRGALT